MSKAQRRTKKPARDVQFDIWGKPIRQRSGEVVERLAMRAADTNDPKSLPQEIVALFTVGRLDTRYDIAGNSLNDKIALVGRKQVTVTGDDFLEIIQEAMQIGFIDAITRYRRKLAGVAELSRIYQRRETTQTKGRLSQSLRADNRAATARRLMKQGKTMAEIVDHFRKNGMPTCNRSTVYNWMKRKRK